MVLRSICPNYYIYWLSLAADNVPILETCPWNHFFSAILLAPHHISQEVRSWMGEACWWALGILQGFYSLQWFQCRCHVRCYHVGSGTPCWSAIFIQLFSFQTHTTRWQYKGTHIPSLCYPIRKDKFCLKRRLKFEFLDANKLFIN